MPKVDKNSVDSEEMLVAVGVRASVRRTASSSTTQRTITSMLTRTSGKGASAARKKVIEVLMMTTISNSAAEAAAGPEEGPVPGSSKSQIKIPIKVTLDTLEEDTMDPSWYEALKGEFTKPYFKKLKEFLVTEHASQTVFPASASISKQVLAELLTQSPKVENIYSWSRFTPLPNVRIVIIGQDPYHDVGQAHGLSFSVLPPNKPPPSLRNIYKQLEADCPGFVASKTSGDLSPVASQGVLWLNTSLTVRSHKAGSHAKKGWEVFTTQVLRAVLQRKGGDVNGVVFMAWGLPAQKTCASLSIDKKKHLLLESAHPSPLSANKGFLGNGHFKRANEWLVSKYGEEAAIDWHVLSAKKS